VCFPKNLKKKKKKKDFFLTKTRRFSLFHYHQQIPSLVFVASTSSFRFCSKNNNNSTMANLEARIIELEKRAKAAEEKLAAASGSSSTGGSDDAATLKRLNEIRAAIVQDQVDAQTVVARKNELEEENAKLKDEIGKLNYRIKHLLRTVESLDKK
jgi:hypothetical protein